MKSKLRLGFADTHEHIAQFFYSLLSKNYEIEIDNTNPEFLIFGDENFGTHNKSYSKKDVTKIFFTGENQRPNDYDCHYAISFDHIENNWHYRLPLYVVYMWALEHIHKTPWKYDYITQVIPQSKIPDKFCSFVVSNPNCAVRNEFFTKLHAIKHVDSAGRLYRNIDIPLEGEKAKIDFLATRKFNICFESFSHPGYVTEKILHAFYANTLPIYWGSPSIKSDFNPDSFIFVNQYKSIDQAIERVIEIDNDDNLYKSIVSQPKLMYNVPTDLMVLDNFLYWFDTIVYKKREARE